MYFIVNIHMYVAVNMRYVLVYVILAVLMVTLDCQERPLKRPPRRDENQEACKDGPGKSDKCLLYRFMKQITQVECSCAFKIVCANLILHNDDK